VHIKAPSPHVSWSTPPLCHYDPGNPLRRWSTEVQEGSHEEIRTLLLQMQVPRGWGAMPCISKRAETAAGLD